MHQPSEILGKAREYVRQLLADRLPPWVRYHRPEHSSETASNAMQIGSAMGLGDQEIEVVEMAAWFHDVGYIDTVEGHEERSVELARKFLTEAGCPADKVNRVIGCIRATRLPQQPTTIEEQVLCDADLLHLGKENFFDRGDLLKEEIELRSGVRHDRAEWLRINLEFLKRHPFHTAFARRMYGPQREANIEEVQRRLAGLSNEDSL